VYTAQKSLNQLIVKYYRERELEQVYINSTM